MNDAKALIRDWIDSTTLGPEEKFERYAAKDIVMRFPYLPPGRNNEIHGFENALQTFREVWKDFKVFEWYDVIIKKIEGEDVYLTTAKSRAIRGAGNAYGNEYVLITRLSDAKVVEHIEYFNPSILHG